MTIGQPMDAGGFATLASYFGDRTVVTHDPRGLGRSVRSDGRTDNDPVRQAEKVDGIPVTERCWGTSAWLRQTSSNEYSPSC